MTRRPRVVVLGDSLSMPRPEKETVVRWEETWPARLEELLRPAFPLVDVIGCGARSMTADRLDLDEHIDLKDPDAVVMQVGIVDCAPRVFTRRTRALLGSRVVPAPIRERIIAYRSARRAELSAADPLRRVYTRPDVYERALRTARDRCRGRAVVVIPVVVGARLARDVPAYTANVALYNEILGRVFGDAVIELPAPITAGGPFTSDGIHLVDEGHALVAAAVAARLGEALARREH